MHRRVVDFLSLGFSKPVIRWVFLRDLRFGCFSYDFFSKVNANGFTVFLWRPVLTFISVILKWNCVICISKLIFPARPANILVLLNHTLYSCGFYSLSGNLNKPMFVFFPCLSYCVFSHTEIQQCVPFSPTSSCFGGSITIFS